MTDYDRPFMDRVWDFTKDISVKVSRRAEKYWKINTLRVEIASIKHRISVKYKELGRFVYESVKSGSPEETNYKSSLQEFYDEISHLENEISEREHRIETLEQQLADDHEPPPAPPVEEDEEERLAREIDDAPPVSKSESDKNEALDESGADTSGNAASKDTSAAKKDSKDDASDGASTAKKTEASKPKKKTTTRKRKTTSTRKRTSASKKTDTSAEDSGDEDKG